MDINEVQIAQERSALLVRFDPFGENVTSSSGLRISLEAAAKALLLAEELEPEQAYAVMKSEIDKEFETASDYLKGIALGIAMMAYTERRG